MINNYILNGGDQSLLRKLYYRQLHDVKQRIIKEIYLAYKKEMEIRR